MDEIREQLLRNKAPAALEILNGCKETLEILLIEVYDNVSLRDETRFRIDQIRDFIRQIEIS